MAGDPALGLRKRQEGYKVKSKNKVNNKAAMMLALVLVVGGLAAVTGSFLQQMLAEKDDMKEYAELLKTTQQSAGGGMAAQPETLDSHAAHPAQEDILPGAREDEQAVALTETSAASGSLEQTLEATAAPVDQADDATSVNLSTYKAQNRDFIAWLYIPGTGVNYPVVWSDDSDYYLNHTFTGRASSVGTLLSLCRTDYAAPSQNIAIYGHHLRTNNMFTPLLSYKKQSFWQEHDSIVLDSLYRRETYRVFAALNMNIQEWDPSVADFPSSEAFMAFVQRAQALSFYDTGVEVNEEDEIVTLITCDRSYAGADGRMVVMAVKQ